MSAIVGVILAAGAAKRFGRAKQLQQCNGQSLLALSQQKIKGLGIPYRVVLGAHFADVCTEVDNELVILNPLWNEGLGKSISVAVKKLQYQAEAILFILADQVALSTSHLHQLLTHYQQNPEKIICAKYAGKLAVPAIFPRAFFSELIHLTGDRGAAGIIKRNASLSIALDMPEAEIDIDTPSDWEDWLSNNPSTK